MKFKRVFIANRGEIALRVMRTCRQLGIETVLGASAADMDSVPARLANRVICIGPPRAGDSYLRAETIVHAALGVGADALHPGYGFLSERPELARLCEENGLCFIGPTAAQIESVGDKLKARQHAQEAGVPVVPGGPLGCLAEAQELARTIGWPVLIKAVGGGGGRGMKRVDDESALAEFMELAQAEASAAFGDSRVYLERFVTKGRHVEVQLLGDGADVIHLGDRDCSIQRRFQKLVEEAPAPNIPQSIIDQMRESAVRFGKHLHYRSLGTVEYLYDVNRAEFYFLEMNARIQVEHPVTEMITGLDLVAEQIAIAEGAPLRLKQTDVKLNGHAIECRINAEDCQNDFRPTPGTVDTANFAEGDGIRVDTHIVSGARVSPYYDSLLAKLIAHGSDRRDAIMRMRDALARCHIAGVSSNIELHSLLMSNSTFADGDVDTGFLPAFLEGRLGHVQD